MVNSLLDMGYHIGKGMNDPIGQFVSHPNLWFMAPEELKDWQFKAIRQAFDYHYDKCEFYRNYCENNGGTKPEEIKSYEDLFKIPQMPVEAFKTTVVSSIPTNRIKTVVTTSGTSGNPSYLVRDFRSLLWTGIPIARWAINHWAIRMVKDAVKRYDGNPERYGMCIGNRKTYEEAIKEGYKESLKNIYTGVFTPEPNETSAWITNAFSTIMPLTKLLAIPIDFYLKGFKFDSEKILKLIKERNKKNKMMLFVGFHYALNELMKYMDKTGEKLSLDPDGSNQCFILMAGGWKKLSGEKVDKAQFKKKLSEHFGIWEPYILDVYGFGESSLLTFDFCPEKIMHIPPTVLAVTRDPETLEIQDYGKEGLLSVWDPTMHSFPSFVITDDIVKLTEPFECECGLTTQTMKYIGRAPEAELRSCGLRLQKSLTEEDEKGLKELKEKQKLRTDIGI
ncbi:MAG: Acyl-protein synthetase (LuxE) domain-containing protein [Candidatus Methanolliviera sp. GoM_asphalt]|nr:MAG: Acyl-protein synthetase (LuxE) domain-containing protein [Candidatus Methanolliviera sp. GoM_asphalt]